MTTTHLSLLDAESLLPTREGKRFVPLFRHGSLQVELYAPRGTDPQTPHAQDEVYVVVQGHGRFYDGERRVAFQTGDLLFVAAGRPHRFENFTDDLSVWVIFYGPDGGEKAEEH